MLRPSLYNIYNNYTTNNRFYSICRICLPKYYRDKSKTRTVVKIKMSLGANEDRNCVRNAMGRVLDLQISKTFIHCTLLGLID
jgi:hypothetical protein